MTPPMACTDADVPLATPKHTVAPCGHPVPWHDPSMQITYPSCSAAASETSGRKRALAGGIPVTPVCHTGLVKAILCPPALDHSPMVLHPVGLVTVQLS